MKIQIYTCNFGAGHRQGAARISNWLNHDFEIEIVDFLELLLPKGAPVIYEQYTNMMRSQGFRYKWYLQGDQHKERMLPFMHPLKKAFFKALDKEPLPDAFVATYSFVAYLLSEYKRVRKLSIPLITMITDFTPHEVWVNKYSDLYIVPTAFTKKEIEKLGVNEKQILIADRTPYPKKEKHKKLHVLITGGGLGLLPQDSEFYEHIRDHFHAEVRIVCGSNEILHDELEQVLGDDFTVYGYVNDMDRQLEWCDVCIGKAGGQSVLEAMERGIPFGYFPAFLPQEERNVAFLSSEKLGFLVDPSDVYSSQIPDELALFSMQKNIDHLLGSTPGTIEMTIERLVENYVESAASIHTWSRRRHFAKPLVQKMSYYSKRAKSSVNL